MDEISRKPTLVSSLADAVHRYRVAHPRSAELHESARRQFPGGSTRSAIYYAPFPLTWASGNGNRLTDVDGIEYLDLLGEYSAGLYGHNNEAIRAAIEKAVRDGTVLGGPNVYEAQLAAAIRSRFPSMELIRFTNSGTEANLMALGTVRALDATRRRIVVFGAGYHGGVFNFRTANPRLVVPFDWLVAPYNDMDATRHLIRANASSICGVIVEPMQGGTCTPGTKPFLRMLRDECTAAGIPLIFDEVMTSRLSAAGLQGLYGIRPDMTTLGKYLGGGASFGAFGGRADIMRRFDPSEPDAFEHAGTFNNNVISMAAGLAGLTQVFTPVAAERLNQLGDHLRNALNDLASKQDLPLEATGLGSLVGLHAVSHRTRAIDTRRGQILTLDRTELERLEALLHIELLNRGFYFGRRGYIALSLPTTTADCDAFVAAIAETCEQYRAAIDAALS